MTAHASEETGKGEMGHLFIALGGANWYNHYGNQ